MYQRGRDQERDRGQATVLGLLMIVFIALTAIGVGEMGSAMSAHQRAQTAADAAALAGANGGAHDAQRVAARNGGTVVAFRRSGQTVTVTVEVDGQRAVAAASTSP